MLCSLVRAALARVCQVLAVALPIFVAVSRLYRGMHFLTDVAADAARFDLSALRPGSLQNAEQR